MDTQVTEAMEWCAKARELLGLLKKGGGYGHGNRMDEAIKELTRDLQLAEQQLKKGPNDGRNQELQREYDLARQELVEIGKLAKSANDRQSNETAQVVSDRLNVLRHRINIKFLGDKDGSQAKSLVEAQERLTQKLEKYRLRYEERLATAQKARKTLFVLNLPGQPVPYEKPVLDAIQEATGLAVLGAYAEAISVLDGVGGILVTQQGLAQADQKRRADAARDKPVYESQRRVIESGLERIKLLPGTATQQQALSLALQQAGQLVKDPSLKYREAFQRLQAAEGQIEAAKSAAQQFEQGVDKPLNGKYGEATKKLAEFKAGYGLGQADAVASLGEQLALVLGRMALQQPDLAGANRLLVDVLESINSKTRVLGVGKTGYEQKIDQARQLIKDAEARTTLAVFQPLLGEFRGAGVEYAAQQYLSAAEKLDRVIDGATRALEAVRVDFEAWELMLNDINAHQLEPLKKAAAEPQKAFQGAGGMLAEFIGARDVLAAQQHQWAQAHAVGVRLQTAVGATDDTGWRKALADLAALAPKRLQGQQAIEAAQATLTKLQDAGGDTADFDKRRDDLARPWFKELDETIDAAAVGKALDTLQQGLTQLQQDIELVLSDPGGKLKDSQGSATAKAQAAALKMRLAEVQAQLDRLEQETPGSTTALAQRLQLARGMPPDQQPAALLAVNGVGEEAQQALQQHQEALLKAQGEARELGRKFVEEAEQLKSKNPSLAKGCEALLYRVQAVLGLADSSVLAVVEDGKNQLGSYRAVFNPQVQTINDIAEKLKALKKRLEDERLGAQLPARKALLAARLEKQLPGQCVADVAKALNPVLLNFEKEISDAVGEAVTAARLKGEITTIADRVDKQLEKLAEAPSLQKAFKARVAAARKPAEGRELMARQDLEGLEQLIAANLSKPEMLASLEQGARQTEAATAEAQSNWEAQVEVFKLREQKAASDLHSRIAQMLGMSTRNEALYKQMQQAFEDAERMAKAGEYVRALDQLGRARRLAKQYADNPDGGKAASTRELQQAVEGWRKTVATFVSDMNSIASQARNSCLADDAYKDNVGAFDIALRRVALAFDASAFDAMANQLEQAKDDLGKRRTAKEEGLRHLRRFQDVMATDPVFALVGESPFGNAPVQQLKERARVLELNLKRA